MPRKYHIAKLMRGKGQQHAKKLCKANKNNLKEHNFKLHIEKLLKLSRKKKAFHQRALKSLNNFKDSSFTYEMALRLDNLYLDDSKSVNCGKDLKIQGLTELNLIHLDLLQQQVDQINEKDKRIRILEEDNKNLKARIEQIDRRVSLSKKFSGIEPLTVNTFLSKEKSRYVDSETQTISKSSIRNTIIKSSPKLSTPSDKLYVDKNDASKLLPKTVELDTLLSSNSTQSLRSSPREKRNRKDSSLLNVNSEVLGIDSINILVIDKKQTLPENKSNIYKKTKLSPNVVIIPDIVEKQITDHSLRSRDKQKDENLRESLCEDLSDQKSVVDSSLNILLETASPVSPETSYKNKDNELSSSIRNSILTTDIPYFRSTTLSPFIYSLSCTDETSEQTQVEIPKWRVKNLCPLYVMEGTENLGDEIFNKRHAKLEHDERRRKRWDLQRMREQRQYERLRERYDSRHNSPDKRQGSHFTLWPKTDSVLSVCVDPELPVCAFGQPLVVMNQDSFFVPWLAKSNQMNPKKKTLLKKI